DVTYHGPGQLMGYPIIKLDDWSLSPRRLVEWVEMFIIQTLSIYNIEAYIHPDLPGVWVGDAKICAIGMRIKDGVSYHGFALNISTDLSYFDGIIPCGIQNRGVCSMKSLLGHPIQENTLRALLAKHALEQLRKCHV
ncbi:MAG: lipoyl(octanoyl) transferase LipB, partial [Candidatus Marinimicrobia bacterium]|nr:lipoyl(octanoyl) transferase LipB [Candidatus Neomarinimicrobiota bacterium]